MKNKVWLFTAALLLFTAGCGKTDLTEKEINGDEQKTIESQETEKTTEKDGNASGEKKSVTENENAELHLGGCYITVSKKLERQVCCCGR